MYKRQTRRKSTELLWINARIRQLIRRRRAIFKESGRNAKWRRWKKFIEELIKTRRDGYFAVQKTIILDEEKSRVFFKNVMRYKSSDKPPVFDVRSLCPGKSDLEVAELLATYFNRISAEFSPLEPAQIPYTYDKTLPLLEPFQVSGRIRHFKKPRSMVTGDVFPKPVSYTHLTLPTIYSV